HAAREAVPLRAARAFRRRCRRGPPRVGGASDPAGVRSAGGRDPDRVRARPSRGGAAKVRRPARAGGDAVTTAVVTGGGSGIGEAICRRLAAEGARVAVLDVDACAATLTAGLIDGLGIEVDVGDSTSVVRALEQAESELGPVDVWVNNAGIQATTE